MGDALWKRLQLLVSVLSILLVLALIAAGAVWWRIRASLPRLDGVRQLTGLSGPVKIERDEYAAVQAVAVDELKVKNPALFDLQRSYADLLLCLADRRLERRLTGFHLAAGTIDLPRAQTALLLHQEDLTVTDDEEQGGMDLRPPACPIDR